MDRVAQDYLLFYGYEGPGASLGGCFSTQATFQAMRLWGLIYSQPDFELFGWCTVSSNAPSATGEGLCKAVSIGTTRGDGLVLRVRLNLGQNKYMGFWQ